MKSKIMFISLLASAMLGLVGCEPEVIVNTIYDAYIPSFKTKDTLVYTNQYGDRVRVLVDTAFERHPYFDDPGEETGHAFDAFLFNLDTPSTPFPIFFYTIEESRFTHKGFGGSKDLEFKYSFGENSQLELFQYHLMDSSKTEIVSGQVKTDLYYWPSPIVFFQVDSVMTSNLYIEKYVGLVKFTVQGTIVWELDTILAY